MFRFKDLMFFCMSVMAFFISLLLLNKLGVYPMLNMLFSTMVFALVNSVYTLKIQHKMAYRLLMVPFLVMIAFLARKDETVLIGLTVLVVMVSSHYLQKNRIFLNKRHQIKGFIGKRHPAKRSSLNFLLKKRKG